jgi:hypothetical protein
MRHLSTVVLAFGTIIAALPAARAKDTICNGQINSGTINGNLSVPPGAQCGLAGVTVTGNVTVSANSTFGVSTGDDGPTVIDGNLRADGCNEVSTGEQNVPQLKVGGNVAIQHCSMVLSNTQIGGNLSWADSAAVQGIVQLSNIKGNVQISNNSGNATKGFAENTVGGNVGITNNTGPMEVGQNTIGGNLSCQGNTDLLGGPNTVGGNKSGQCSGF